MTLDAVLSDGLAELGLVLPEYGQNRLLEFVRLLAHWNRVYNLTGVTIPEDMVRRHLLDSLALLPYARGPRMIDVGSGAGLPGIPLAIARPDCHFVLLDARAKKTRFLTQAVVELGLPNVEVVRMRVEDYLPTEPFDTVVARAFAALPRMLRLVRHLCRPGSLVLAMKAALDSGELDDLPADCTLLDVLPLRIPGLAAQRRLVRIAIAEPRG